MVWVFSVLEVFSFFWDGQCWPMTSFCVYIYFSFVIPVAYWPSVWNFGLRSLEFAKNGQMLLMKEGPPHRTTTSTTATTTTTTTTTNNDNNNNNNNDLRITATAARSIRMPTCASPVRRRIIRCRTCPRKKLGDPNQGGKWPALIREANS